MSPAARRAAALALTALVVGAAGMAGAAGPARAVPAVRSASAPPSAAGAAAAALAAGGSSSSGAGSSGPQLRLYSQDSWALPRRPFNLGVSVSGAGQDRSGLVLEVAVFRRLFTRSAFAQSQAGRGLGSVLWSEAPALSDLSQGPGGQYLICVPVDVAPDTGCPAPAGLTIDGEAGVYPVQISLRRGVGGTVLSRIITHLVVVPAQAAANRLQVSLVLPFAAPRALLPGGGRHLSSPDVARLASVTSVVEQDHSGLPVTLAPDPATLAALADTTTRPAQATLAALRRAVTGAQVLAQPFAPVAPYDLVVSGLAPELSAQLQRGGDIESGELGSRPSPRTWLVNGPVDRSTVDRLTDLGVTRLVVPVGDLASTGTSRTPAQPYRLDAGPDVIDVAVEDPALTADLTLADPVLGAHELLADLAQTYFEEPNGPPRGVVALAPNYWDPGRQAAAILAGALTTSPVLLATTLDGLFEAVPASSRQHEAAPPPRRPLLPAGRIRSDRARQQSLTASLAGSLPQAVSINDLLLASEADGLSASQRSEYLRGSERVLGAQLDQVTVVNSSITLTARKGQLPISVQSALPVPMAVRLDLSSDALAFANGSNHDTVSGRLLLRNTTFSIPVVTRTIGSFPLRIRVHTADGRLLVTSARLTVKSTAFSGVGIVLSAGALIFLAVWWGRALVAGRRMRNPRLVDREEL